MNEQWKVKVGTDEQPVSGPAEIAELVKAGKANAETYVWNPVLQKWLYARDVAELATVFKGQKAKYLNHLSWLFFLVAIILELVVGMKLLGAVAFLAAIGLAIAYYIQRPSRREVAAQVKAPAVVPPTSPGGPTGASARSGMFKAGLLIFSLFAAGIVAVVLFGKFTESRAQPEEPQGPSARSVDTPSVHTNIPTDSVPAPSAGRRLGKIREAAESGDAKAQYDLAEMYRHGDEVPEDSAEAAKWFERAANQGDMAAQYSLVAPYIKGDGVTKDLVQAYKWAALAASVDSEYATEFAKSRDGIAAIMSADKLAEAQRLVREWRPMDERQPVDSSPSPAIELGTSASAAEPEYADEADIQKALDDLNRRLAESAKEPAVKAPRKKVMVTIEFVYASAKTRLFHRKGCPEFSNALVRVRIDSAKGQGIKEHAACAHLPGEFETFEQ